MLSDLYTAWLLKGILESLQSFIENNEETVTPTTVAKWFNNKPVENICPYYELGYWFDSLIIDSFSEQFSEKWYEWTLNSSK